MLYEVITSYSTRSSGDALIAEIRSGDISETLTIRPDESGKLAIFHE